MKNISWKNDHVILFGKNVVTKRKTVWYGALPWTRELSGLKQMVEGFAG